VTHYALSLKQPWAALLVHGRKTVEVRRWATRRRGAVLIHAARVPDLRREVWERLPPELLLEAQLVGGIIGAAELTGVVAYPSPQLFVADCARHLNDPSWFQPPRLYGFVFANPRPLDFHRCPGNVRFFTVEYAPEGRP